MLYISYILLFFLGGFMNEQVVKEIVSKAISDAVFNTVDAVQSEHGVFDIEGGVDIDALVAKLKEAGIK